MESGLRRGSYLVRGSDVVDSDVSIVVGEEIVRVVELNGSLNEDVVGIGEEMEEV